MSASQVEISFEDLPPDPTATIESLGSLGYSPQSAIADLIDNSISAGASHIAVWMHWNGAESWCAVIDNGTGMDEEALRQAMKIGSKDPLALRSSSDLGRFGCGLEDSFFFAGKTNVSCHANVNVDTFDRTNLGFGSCPEVRQMGAHDLSPKSDHLNH